MSITESFCCTAETGTALQINYTSIFRKQNKNKDSDQSLACIR